MKGPRRGISGIGRSGPTAGSVSWFVDATGRARATGVLFLLGPLFAEVQLYFSANKHRQPLIFQAACAVWFVTGLVLVSRQGSRFSAGSFKVLLLLSTAVISVAVFAAGTPGTGMFFYYLWLVPYSFVFFSARQAVAQVVWVGLCTTGVVLAQDHLSAGGALRSHVPLLLGVITSLAVIGTLARRLTEGVVEAEARFGRGFESSPLGLGFVSAGGEWLHVNEAMCAIVGRPSGEIEGQAAESTLGSEIPAALDFRHGSSTERTFTVTRPDGEEVIVAATFVTVRTPRREPYLYVQLVDVTTSQRDQAALVRQATHDALTGLPNRRAFTERLVAALARTQADTDVAVILADLDGFKHINDSLGHHVGDEVLAAMAPRLRAALRSDDLVARLGGDEFVVLCEDVVDVSDVMARASRLLAVLSEPVELSSGHHSLSASVGVSLAGRTPTTGAVMLANADAAMYQAKALGRGRIEVFGVALRQRVDERLHLEQELRDGLRGDQFVLEYQPIVDARTGGPVALEALIRWDHPTRGRLAPASFIGVAEETGLIVDIGAWALKTAACQLAAWQRALPRPVPLEVTVNVSARQLQTAGFVAEAITAFETNDLGPGRIGLEITESVLADADPTPASRLRALRELGATIHLDDFGTGYSSLAYLKRFPVDGLKVDQSFVAGLGSPEETAIVEAVIGLARALDLQVVAEGVETPAQLAQLQTMGCHVVQGFLIAHPLPADEVPGWLRARIWPQLTAPVARPALDPLPMPALDGAPAPALGDLALDA